MYRLYGHYSSVEYLKVCVNLNSIAHLIDRKRCEFIDSLMSDVRFSNLLLICMGTELCVIGYVLCTDLRLSFYSVLFLVLVMLCVAFNCEINYILITLMLTVGYER